MIRGFGKFLVIGILLLIAPNVVSGQEFTFRNTPLLDAIEKIENETSFLFLYRESQISGINISFKSKADSVFAHLESSLEQERLRIKVNREQQQVLIYKPANQREIANNYSVSGIVVDDETGERLSYATVTWIDRGKLNGAAADASGSFTFSPDSERDSLTITASFVGYAPKDLILDFEERENWMEVTIRLTPQYYTGKEIIVRGFNFYTPSDTLRQGLLKTASFNPLGETNTVRTLQLLPAVSTNTAINNGVNIRGSSSDGLQVLLDGMSIYNQDHLFGLLDAMNSDVLKTTGFHYDITPAQFQAPPGGTLSLITRTGSLQSVKGSAGISNTAVKSTLEGPFVKGRASWIISGRASFMDQIDWFGNQNLVEYGLDVDRPAEVTGLRVLQNASRWSAEIISPQISETNALFYDLHAKTYVEGKNGDQLMVSGYLGQDKTSQNYSRAVTDDESLDFETSNDWETRTLSGNYYTSFPSGFTSQTSAGFSSYHTKFDKDDFIYQVSNRQNPRFADTVRVAPLSLENDLQEINVEQSFSKKRGNEYSLNLGLSYSDFIVKYAERNYPQSLFRSRRTSQLAGAFVQLDITRFDAADMFVGNRLHYFSNGKYVRWSPRVKVQLYPADQISLGLGYSRNYQFIHQISLFNINSADFWILSNEKQPPSAMDYVTASVHLNVSPLFYFQAEAYLKNLENMRLHQLNTSLTSDSFRDYESPIFTNNTGSAQGIEFMMRNRFHPLTLTTTYTLSQIELENELINNGEPFYPLWDRRHQVNVVAEVGLLTGLRAFVALQYASGTPDRFRLNGDRVERLDDYWRTDVSITYSTQLKRNRLETAVSFYNIFDRQNPWYTELSPVLLTRDRFFQGQGQGPQMERQGVAETTTYDLGFQASFSLTVWF